MLYNAATSTGESLQRPQRSVNLRYVNDERRKAKALQAVGWPNSTDEGVKFRGWIFFPCGT